MTHPWVFNFAMLWRIIMSTYFELISQSKCWGGLKISQPSSCGLVLWLDSWSCQHWPWHYLLKIVRCYRVWEGGVDSMQLQCCGICKKRTPFSKFHIMWLIITIILATVLWWFGSGPVTLWEEHSVWDWAGYTVGRMLSFGLGWLHCEKNTRFWTGPVTMWKTHGMGLGQSHCGNNTWFGTGPVMLWEEHRLRVFENEAGEDIRA